MPTETEPEKIEYSPLLADIFTGMFTATENTTNAVFDNYERQIAELKADYCKLFEQVEKANVRIDSLQIARILDGAGWKYDNAAKSARKDAY